MWAKAVQILIAGTLILSACQSRGRVTIDRSAAEVGSVERILVATSRTASAGPEIYGRGRSPTLGFAQFDISVPPNRAPGTLTFPDSEPADPRTDFLTVDAKRFPNHRAFLTAVNAALADQPPGKRRLFVFVHGFNTNFAEGVYRQAQMEHDLATPVLGVNYSWPSAADAWLYGYDRDSVFFARDGLEKLLRLLAESRTEGITVVGHSMGAQVSLEALRQMAIAGAPRFFGKLDAVAFLSPDIDVDVFRGAVTPLVPMHIPWLIFVSSQDRALRVASLIHGQKERLGSVVDPEALANFDVTIIDMSGVSEGDQLHHSVAESSPVMISLVQGLARYGPTILNEEKGNIGLAATTENVVQGVTDVVVSPLARVGKP